MQTCLWLLVVRLGCLCDCDVFDRIDLSRVKTCMLSSSTFWIHVMCPPLCSSLYSYSGTVSGNPLKVWHHFRPAETLGKPTNPYGPKKDRSNIDIYPGFIEKLSLSIITLFRPVGKTSINSPISYPFFMGFLCLLFFLLFSCSWQNAYLAGLGPGAWRPIGDGLLLVLGGEEE